MEGNNQTMVTEFILIGFSSISSSPLVLSVVFVSAYAAALVGNISIITLIGLCSTLHTPMYFFLINLSLLDLCCTTAVVPQMLRNLMNEKKTISFQGCLTQAYFFVIFLITELLLLVVMAFDRYIAICHPLRYTVIMNQKVCNYLVIGIWLCGVLLANIHVLSLLRLSFCGPSTINHFFCELPPLLQLSCTDTSFNRYLMLVTDIFLGFGCFLLTLVSYVYIASSILKIRSTQGKKKAFSTCSSHVIVVTIFYSSAIYTYVRPPYLYQDIDKIVAVLYTVLTPVLNPLIYSLRNKEVKEAFKKSVRLNRN
ncbi:olfactory receptor 5V1-like [Sceloporus undulatus]|uniref:olfactory receptor 5V1-like n=1 Tax=Sceloporus undulatus TaxID=8520 RepID=UPI001C4A875C|nr:olfactory receptor 5V1-like [Sceloporus undulatus]